MMTKKEMEQLLCFKNVENWNQGGDLISEMLPMQS